MDSPDTNNSFRVSHEPFALSREERFRHVFVDGKTGYGKSTFLFNQAVNDIEAGYGIAYIDPAGDDAERLIDCIPPSRTNDVIYLDVTDTEFPVSFNPVAGVPEKDRPHRTADIVSALAHIYRADNSWGHSTQQVMRHSIRTLMDTPGMSLVALPRLLTDDSFRKRLVANVRDPLTFQYWYSQFSEYQTAMRDQKISAPMNKIEEILDQPNVRNILAAGENRLDPRAIIDQKKILICNLSKGAIGEHATNVFGSFIVALLGQAALARIGIAEEERVEFFLYVDEFHNFTSDTFASFLAELRKFRFGLTLASQYINQCSDKVRDAILNTIGTLIVFEVGAEEAELLGDQLDGLSSSELSNQAIGHAWLRRVSGDNSWTGSRRDHIHLPERSIPRAGRRAAVVSRSRRTYARPRAEIEASMYRYFSKMPPKPGQKPPAVARKSISPQFPPTLNVRTLFLDALARYDNGDGLTDSRQSARYAPRIIANEIQAPWSVKQLADTMGALLAEGEVKVIKFARPGRPTISKLVPKNYPEASNDKDG